MIIELNRIEETNLSVIGEMFIDGYKFYTLEPSRKTPVNAGHPCINAGVYELTRSYSPDLKYNTPELVAVPNRTDIRIHIGNFPKDTLGCILIGRISGDNVIRQSTQAFDTFMKSFNLAIDKKQETKIIISDHTFGVFNK